MVQAHAFNARLASGSAYPVSTKPRAFAVEDRAKSARPDRLTFSGASQVVDLAGINSRQYTVKVLGSEKEIPGLADFIREMFGKTSATKTRADYVDYYTQAFRNGSFTYIIYSPDSSPNAKKLIGSASLTSDGYIHSVCVHSGHRRKNLARAMMKGLIQEAERRNLSKVYLSANNPHAIALYKSLGFQVAGNTGQPQEKMMKLKLRSMTASIRRSFQIGCQTVYLKFRNFLGTIWHRLKQWFSGKPKD